MADHPFVRAAGPLVPLVVGDAGPASLIGNVSAGRRTFIFAWPGAPIQVELQIETAPAGDALRLGGRIRNAGGVDGRITATAALDLSFELAPGALGPPTVHHAGAGPSRGCFPPAAFAPRRTTLLAAPGQAARLNLGGLRRDLPMLRISAAGDRCGLFAGIAAAAGWEIDISLTVGRRGPILRLTAGPPEIDITLSAGESLPLPGAFLGFYTGDAADGANALRRFLRGLHPSRGPAPVCRTLFSTFGNAVTAADMLAQIGPAAKMGCEHIVLDAGWPAGAGRGHDTGQSAGTLRPDPARFPQGLAPLSAAARAAGMGFGLGLDIERAHTASDLAHEHPDWLLYPDGASPADFVGTAGIDFARADVRDWAVGLLDGLAAGAGLTWLRLDSGLDPLPLLSAADGFGRTGESALRNAEGLYGVVEELRRRRPGLIIELGPAGGRRIDFRWFAAADLFRIADGAEDPDVLRRLVLGAADMLPPERLLADAAGIAAADGRNLAGCAAGLSVGRDDGGADSAISTMKCVRASLAGDGYALVADAAAPGDWDGRQFHDPAAQAGFVLAFHSDPPAPRPLHLRGLALDRTYHFVDPLSGVDFYRTGRMAMADGIDLSDIRFRNHEPDRGKIFTYRAVNG